MATAFLCRFGLDLLEALDRVDPHSSGRLMARLPERLVECLLLVRQSASDPSATLPLDDAEELLLAIDATLGDGSGRKLESAAYIVASRVLSHRGGVLIPGDPTATVARLRAPLEHPFIGVDVQYSVVDTDLGFELQLSVVGRPRSTRLLRYLAVGYIKAAHTFGSSDQAELRLYPEVTGDKGSVMARFKRPTMAPPPPPAAPARDTPAPYRRKPSVSRMPAVGSLSDEVERIMESMPAPAARSSDRVRRVSSTQFKALSASDFPPPARLPSEGERAGAESSLPPEPKSGNYRVSGRYRYRESTDPPAKRVSGFSTIDDELPPAQVDRKRRR